MLLLTLTNVWDEYSSNFYARTHTHTHTYIYIYIYADCKGNVGFVHFRVLVFPPLYISTADGCLPPFRILTSLVCSKRHIGKAQSCIRRFDVTTFNWFSKVLSSWLPRQVIVINLRFGDRMLRRHQVTDVIQLPAFPNYLRKPECWTWRAELISWFTGTSDALSAWCNFVEFRSCEF